MHSRISLPLLGAAALAVASPQAPPDPVLLTMTKSGVLPVAPTPFNGVETLEGAIINDGPMNPGFVGPGGSASVQSNLPSATYQATLPSASNFDENTGSLITGSIVGSSTAGGSGVTFSVNFGGFPDEAQYGPFVYHIHGMPVPADGNCTATMGHLDPTNRGEYYPCDVANPQTCQAGDLAGKHGNITSPTFSATLTCANFMMTMGNSTNGTSTTSPSSPSMPSPSMFTGAASTIGGSLSAVFGVGALLALL
ncbi:MAG: hypothetical protein Q9227_001524 [Pyrenula ochraceoflavens]